MRVTEPVKTRGQLMGCLVGFEPTSSGATVRRSTAELQAPHGGILESFIIATVWRKRWDRRWTKKVRVLAWRGSARRTKDLSRVRRPYIGSPWHEAELNRAGSWCRR